MNVRRSSICIAAAFAATLCWGAGMTLTKLALGYFTPSVLLVVQLLASILFLALLLPVLRIRIASWPRLLRVSGLGLLEPGLAYFLGLEGLQRIGAAEAVVLSSTESILVILLAWLLAIERPRGIVLGLAVLGAIGATLVAGSHLEQLGGSLSLWGDLLLLGGVLSAAGYVVLSARVASSTEPLPSLLGQQGVAVLFAIAMHLVISGHWPAVSSVPANGWLLAAASGIVQYACAFWLYLWALKGLRAGEAGLYLSLIPVFGLLIAIPVFRERLSALQWTGALLIIGTIFVLTRVHDEHAGHVAAGADDEPAPAGNASPLRVGSAAVG
ncbi:MAG TPA: DMT family transporter [Steroidobacteraceae bacterium]|nr:DMT family transporter [Steroidobacteraceae bacterium]